jgi:hypothetical protein
MNIYIVKSNLPDQAHNLGVHTSKRKAFNHFNLVRQSRLDRGDIINWENFSPINLGPKTELQSTRINHETITLERWKC